VGGPHRFNIADVDEPRIAKVHNELVIEILIKELIDPSQMFEVGYDTAL
jgi:hypothetical protein